MPELHHWQADGDPEVFEGRREQHDRPRDARRSAGRHRGLAGSDRREGRGHQVGGEAVQQRLRPQVPHVGVKPDGEGDRRGAAAVCEGPVLPAEAASAHRRARAGLRHGRGGRSRLRVRRGHLREGGILRHERDQARRRCDDVHSVHHPPHHLHQERLPARARRREPVRRDSEGLRHRQRRRGGREGAAGRVPDALQQDDALRAGRGRGDEGGRDEHGRHPALLLHDELRRRGRGGGAEGSRGEVRH
mmetsp:Transcript_68393/g.211477  ORF Transcript_68393/g.211477 Transcript_68393/m.211477 type:complete len:247 (+) Transcript_68393:359-1099(+)